MARTRLVLQRGRVDSEEDQSVLLQKVYEYSTQVPKLSVEQIAELVNRSVRMVKYYRKQLIDAGKLERTESGHVKISRIAVQKQQYEDLLKSDFCQILSVRKWVERMEKGGKKGTGVSNRKSMLTIFYNICRTLQVSPDAFLGSVDQVKTLMDKFATLYHDGNAIFSSKNNQQKLKHGKETSLRTYAVAIANFCMRNDKPLPEGLDGTISRKKDNFGAYANVQLSDKEWLGAIDFVKNHPEGGEQWAAAVALNHEMIARTDTFLKWKNNLQFKTITIDGVKCEYAVAPQVYEKKTHKTYDKLVIHPVALEYAKKLQLNKNVIPSPNVDKTTGHFNRLLREYYVSIGRIDRESLTNLMNYYKKAVDGDKYYLWYSPNYALRHSGCHRWSRRCQYNVTFVMSLGWDDPNMVIHVYGKMDNEFRLRAGACKYCNPEAVEDEHSNEFFCSWNHAIVYYNNGFKSRRQMFKERADAITSRYNEAKQGGNVEEMRQCEIELAEIQQKIMFIAMH